MNIGAVTAAMAQTGGLLLIPLAILLIITLVYYFRAEDSEDASIKRQAATKFRSFLGGSFVMGGIIVALWILSIWIGVTA